MPFKMKRFTALFENATNWSTMATIMVEFASNLHHFVQNQLSSLRPATGELEGSQSTSCNGGTCTWTTRDQSKVSTGY